ncbi:hypothetical protein FACS189494_06710 [Spirochaetia bacterium]|nr:hypothetical protein FACS189494_06710 [Spirochaetia bacterium]
MAEKIGVINYGAGNLGSIMNALQSIGAEASFVRSPDEMMGGKNTYEKIIFPGDGHFAQAMKSLNESGYAQAIKEWITADKPFLGICIGLQLLFDASQEAQPVDGVAVHGLGVIGGTVKLFPARKIPQIGWNKTFAKPGSSLFAGIPPESYFYYIHSYYCAPENDGVTAAHAEYYQKYCAAIERGNLAAVQFHPEKSGAAGMRLLENWIGQKKCLAPVFAPSVFGGAPSYQKDAGNNLAKRIIPCLDVDDGRVVKGVKFKGVADAGDPVEMARRYNDDDADELTFLDIGASYKSRATLLGVVERVAREVFIPLCVGGGVRTVADMRDAMNAGADKVSVCTSALQRPELLAEMAAAYGRQCVVLSIDAKQAANAADGAPVWHAFSRGGRDDTGIDAIEWAVRAAALGAGEILLNSIDADGTGAGYDLELTRTVVNAVNVPVIASGGAGSLLQIAQAAQAADAALVASLLHFGKTTIQEIKNYCVKQGVVVR